MKNNAIANKHELVTTTLAFPQCAVLVRISMGLGACLFTSFLCWATGFEFKAIGFLIGTWLFASIIRQQESITFRPLVVGLVLYFGTLCLAFKNELTGDFDQLLSVLSDVTLLIPPEPFSCWHALASLTAFLGFVLTPATGDQSWVERYTWVK